MCHIAEALIRSMSHCVTLSHYEPDVKAPTLLPPFGAVQVALMPLLRLLCASVLAFGTSQAAAQIALTGAPIQENFDTLVASGTGTAAQLPVGWSFLETSGNTTYTATDGTANGGDTYSVGAAASTDRAFGSIASNSNQATIGAQFINQTGSTIGNLTLQYVGEQWRSGGSTFVDRLNFAISTDATALGTGVWTEVDELDFVAPNLTTAPSGTVLDGNASANQSTVSFTIPGLSIGVGQTFWIRWVDPNITGADDLLAIDNLIVSTTGAVDVAPNVSNTTPANNAINIDGSANLSVQFSEAVTTNPGWFSLNCSTSGNVSVGETGAGATRTLDPVPTLAFGESCTAVITAANVIDQDGTPDPMAADYQFAFTIAVDNPPAVNSTTPANAVSNVSIASNLLVNFSEAVTTSGSWFSIQCANSGAHTAVASGGPSNYTLNPDVDFDLLEQCTVTLTAALILDQDGTPDPLISDYVWNFTTAASASNYYNGVNSSNATVLRTTLHNTIKDHQAYRYSIGSNTCVLSAPTTAACDVWDILESAEQDPADPNRVLDVYRNRSYAKITDRSGNTGPNNYNREHTWPNSHGFNDLSGTDGNGNAYSPYVDAHMLYASASDYNSNRGNKPYDNCGTPRSENATDLNSGFGGGTGVYPGNSNWDCPAAYEAWNHRKGDMARAILYMDVRYEGGNHSNGQAEPDLIATNNTALIAIVTPSGQVPAAGYMGMLSTLLAWHAADPPDANEVLRNEIVYGFQGNRNPFIDHPEWVACLWQDQCTASSDLFANGFE